MNDIEVSYTWLDFGSNDAPEIDATFADFKLAIDGQVITRILDKRAQTTRDIIRTPLFPLAEWLVTNWWSVFYEERTPSKPQAAADRESRHCLYGAQEGFALPRLNIYSEGDNVYLSWMASHSEYQHVEFISTGDVSVPRPAFHKAAVKIIEAVLDRLDSLGIPSPALLENWSAIQNSDHEETEFCTAAALLGMDPYEIPDDTGQLMIELWSQIPVGLRADAFSASTIEKLPEVGRWIREGLEKIRPAPESQTRIQRRAGLYPKPKLGNIATPWEYGYTLARHARKKLKLPEGVAVNLDDFTDQNSSPARSTPLPTIDGLAGFRRQLITCYTNKRRPESLRFMVARSMLSLLYGSNSNVILLTSAITARQQSERAFAAELLIPSTTIKARIISEEITQDEIADIAADYSVSNFVVEYQIRNHHLAKISDV